MDYGHPLAFGAFVTPGNADPLAPVELARRAEEVGLDLVTFQDHPYQPRFHDTWTLLSWVAARTERIRLAPSVIDVPMRPATVLARAAASLDLLSKGRLDLGIGAGFFWDAMEAMGVERLTPGQSVDALGEAIEVLRGIWAASDPRPLSVHGQHHRAAGAQRGPAPAHDIGIWVGGARPRMLRLIGAKADGWVVPDGTAGLDALADGNRAIDDAAREAGRDPREIVRVLNVSGRFADRDGGLLDGPPAQWVEQLLPAVLEHGVGTLVLATDDAADMERFAAEVAPTLREAVAAERADRGTATGVVRRLEVRARRREGIDYDAVPAELRADAVEPGDAAYGAVRSGYMRGGAPGLVLRPGDPPQVAQALAFARTQDVPLGIRSGGHGISGRSTNDGGIVVDLSRMDRVEVLDRAARLVRVEAGARWGDVAAALVPRGWAITSGDYGGVGVGGLATAGGVGLLGRLQGLTIDRVRAAELVLADGTHVRASATENPDLFWGVRGAGFALGVVTAFELEAGEVGDVGYAQLVHDATDTARFLEAWGAAVEASPRDVTSFLLMGRPDGGQVVAQSMTVVASDDAGTILERLQPFAGIAPLLGQHVVLTPYSGVVAAPSATHAAQGEPVSRNGTLEHVTSAFARDAVDLLHSGATFFFQIRSTGGAAGDVDPDATAYAHRSANFVVSAIGASEARLGAAWEPLRAHMTGEYVSFGTDRSPERLLDAYPPRTLERLRELKRRYDPDNVLRDNVDLGVAAPVPLDTPSASRNAHPFG